MRAALWSAAAKLSLSLSCGRTEASENGKRQLHAAPYTHLALVRPGDTDIYGIVCARHDLADEARKAAGAHGRAPRPIALSLPATSKTKVSQQGSGTSVTRYKGAGKPLQEIARELNVEAVVEGTVRRQGDRVRVTANLIHAATDEHLWAAAFERDLKDTLAVQSDLTSAIADGIRSKLVIRPERRREEAARRPIKPEAYEAYLRGRYYTQRFTIEGFKKSNEYLTKAIEVDPDYAPAYAALADNHTWASLNLGFQAGEDLRARECASRALELDPTLAEAHAALADLTF